MDGQWSYYIRMLGVYGKFRGGSWSWRSWLVGSFGFIGLFGKVGVVVWNRNGIMDGSVRVEDMGIINL